MSSGLCTSIPESGFGSAGCRGGGIGCTGVQGVLHLYGSMGTGGATRPLPGGREAFKESMQIWEGGGSALPAEPEFIVCGVHWG